MSDKLTHAGAFHWHVELNVECPHCGESFDANDAPDFGEQLSGKQIAQAVNLCQVECPECEREFVLDIEDGL